VRSVKRHNHQNRSRRALFVKETGSHMCGRKKGWRKKKRKLLRAKTTPWGSEKLGGEAREVTENRKRATQNQKAQLGESSVHHQV